MILIFVYKFVSICLLCDVDNISLLWTLDMHGMLAFSRFKAVALHCLRTPFNRGNLFRWKTRVELFTYAILYLLTVMKHVSQSFLFYYWPVKPDFYSAWACLYWCGISSAFWLKHSMKMSPLIQNHLTTLIEAFQEHVPTDTESAPPLIEAFKEHVSIDTESSHPSD